MASYGSGMYQSYFPQYYTPQYPQSPPNQTSNGIIWVQGEAGAKSYMVAPNNTVQLWDSESQTIYLKSADASGMPSMRILDYTIRSGDGTNNKAFVTGSTDTPTREEIDAIRSQINALQARVDSMATLKEDKNG